MPRGLSEGILIFMVNIANTKIRCLTVFGIAALSALAGCTVLQPAQPKPPVPRPAVGVFRAEPSKVEQGTATSLSWEVTGADNVTIDHGIGRVEASGSIAVKPSEVTAYNLTAVNSGGTVVSSVIINVVPFVMRAASLPPAPAAVPDTASHNIPSGALPQLNDDEEYVFYQGAVMVGADNHYIVLRNNPAAKNPTWADLKAFLKSDQTDRQAYVTGRFTCGDFAEMLHNNAEAAGIRTAIMAIELRPASLAEGVIYHSLNAFETTDRGMIYIDDTSSAQGYYADKEGNVAVGADYATVSIFPQPGQMLTWPSMGRIEAIDVFQW